VLLPTVALASGCGVRDTTERVLNVGFPEPVSRAGREHLQPLAGLGGCGLVVGVAVWILIFIAGFKYRKKSEQLPRQVRYNLPIEVLYTVVPFVIIAVLFYYTTVSQNFVNQLSDDGDGRAAARRHHRRRRLPVELAVQLRRRGRRRHRPDDAAPVLVLPTDRTIRFIETSPDVIHSFWVPEFLFKRDVIPGRANTFEITLTKEGEYIGRCAEFCGEKHSAMNFVVRVVSPDDYDDYISDLQSDPANEIGTGVGTGAVDAEATSGSDS
jgi:cytochrome c oxidase subunit 2